MVEPPSLLGVAHETVVCKLPAGAVTEVGAPGTAGGVTADDAADAALSPTAFMATTVDVSLVSPPSEARLRSYP